MVSPGYRTGLTFLVRASRQKGLEKLKARLTLLGGPAPIGHVVNIQDNEESCTFNHSTRVDITHCAGHVTHW